MKEREEAEFHRKMKKIEGKYSTESGKITVTLKAIPNYAGGKGCPDEILIIKVELAILGTDVQLSAPVLIELEKVGYTGAKEDLDKFCERSISGEQKSYLDIPMIIIGGDKYKKLKSQNRQLLTKVNITQVPKRIIK